MPSFIERKYYTSTNKKSLEDFISKHEGKVIILFGQATEQRPFTDYSCVIESLEDRLFSYSIEGHGIGSNRKPDSPLEETLKSIFLDCQRFSGSDLITIESSSKKAI